MKFIEWIDAPAFRRSAVADDTTPHYLVFNADTRVLFCHPDTLVLHDADIDSPQAFATRLASAPYWLHVPAHGWHVRQMFVRPRECYHMSLPHACTDVIKRFGA